MWLVACLCGTLSDILRPNDRQVVRELVYHSVSSVLHNVLLFRRFEVADSSCHGPHSRIQASRDATTFRLVDRQITYIRACSLTLCLQSWSLAVSQRRTGCRRRDHAIDCAAIRLFSGDWITAGLAGAQTGHRQRVCMSWAAACRALSSRKIS